MLDTARSALAALTAAERGTTVTVKRAAVVTSPVGGDSLDWSNPVTVTTIGGRFQPITAEAVEAAGLTGLANRKVLHLDDVALTPVTHRLYVGAVVYDVDAVSRWEGSHVEAIVKVRSDG